MLRYKLGWALLFLFLLAILKHINLLDIFALCNPTLIVNLIMVFGSIKEVEHLAWSLLYGIALGSLSWSS